MKRILLSLLSVAVAVCFVGCKREEIMLVPPEIDLEAPYNETVSGIVTELCYEDNFSTIPYGIELEIKDSAKRVFALSQNTEYFFFYTQDGNTKTASLEDIRVGKEIEVDCTTTKGTTHVTEIKITERPKITPVSEPPQLTILVDAQDEVMAMRGSYSWNTKGKDGKDSCVIADGLHPLNALEYMPILEITDNTKIGLRFPDDLPDKINCIRWREADFNDPDVTGENVEITPDFVFGFYLQEKTNGVVYTFVPEIGNYIYAVTAEWTTYDEYSGQAEYCFYTKAE